MFWNIIILIVVGFMGLSIYLRYLIIINHLNKKLFVKIDETVIRLKDISFVQIQDRTLIVSLKKPYISQKEKSTVLKFHFTTKDHIINWYSHIVELLNQ